MIVRRDFLKTLAVTGFGASLPEFVAAAAPALAKATQDKVLVVLEMTGGNDGLNTLCPHGDDAYHKLRPTLRRKKAETLDLDGYVGLNPSMRQFKDLFDQKRLAVVQGVGYPNPDHSHFEAMDIWHSADPKRKTPSGWLGRAIGKLSTGEVAMPCVHLAGGNNVLPLAVQSADGKAVSVNSENYSPPGLTVNADDRKPLLDSLAQLPAAGDDSPLAFARRRQIQAVASIERLRELLDARAKDQNNQNLSALGKKLSLVGSMIAAGLGGRIFYVSIDGFDTHSQQTQAHANLLADMANSVGQFLQQMRQQGHGDRVALMTFSEFGRRADENASKGTDHGSGSCLFVAGPEMKTGLVGKHPSLTELDNGDLRWNLDFRRVYTTMLEGWLGCPAIDVIEGDFAALDFLKS